MRQTTLALILATLAGPLAAQTSPQVTNDLTIDMAPQQYRICNDRPARPTWMDELHPREAYRATTMMDLYEIRAWQEIVAASDCSCDTRFPAWDSADAEYREQHKGLSQGEHTALRLEWIDKRKQLEPIVRDICEMQGNW